jgi:calcium-dependent protein kinase
LIDAWGEAKSHSVEVDTLIKSLDKDGNGQISYNEFITAAIDKEELLNQENLRKAFNIFDLV